MVTGGFRTAEGMNAALRSGALDIVGLARLLAIDPDAPAALLQGRDSPQRVRPITTGIKPVDRMGIMEVLWYTRQLKRIAEGGNPRARRKRPGCIPQDLDIEPMGNLPDQAHARLSSSSHWPANPPSIHRIENLKAPAMRNPLKTAALTFALAAMPLMSFTTAANAQQPGATMASPPPAEQAQATSWANVPTQSITAGGVDFAYRELGKHHGGTPVVLLVHLAAVLDNWDPRIVDGLAAKHHVIAFDNRGIGASSGSPSSSMEQMADDAITFIKAKGFKQVDLFGFSMGGMIAQEIVLKDPQLVRKMILAGTGPAGGEGISTVAGVTFYDILRGFFTGQDPKQFLFFTRTPGGIEAGKAFLERLKERAQNRDTEITVSALFAQLEALRTWGLKEPADLSVVKHPVLVANGDADRMVPTTNTHDLARRLPNSTLIIYPDSGHGAIFQFHADFVPKALEFLAR